jgi:hypothetical protein
MGAAALTTLLGVHSGMIDATDGELIRVERMRQKTNFMGLAIDAVHHLNALQNAKFPGF